MEKIMQLVQHYGYVGIFSLLVLGIVGLPVPDEWLLTFAGYLVYKGDLYLAPTIATAFLGSVCGITLSYTLGRTFGFYLLHRYGYILHVTDERIKQVHDWFRRMGRWALMFGYFIPGVRHLTAYVAGTSKLEIPVFALFAYTGGLLWSVTFISLGFFLGDKWSPILEKIHRHLLIALVIAGCLLVIYFFLVQRRKNKSR